MDNTEMFRKRFEAVAEPLRKRFRDELMAREDEQAIGLQKHCNQLRELRGEQLKFFL